jgi:ferritin-like protein
MTTTAKKVRKPAALVAAEKCIVELEKKLLEAKNGSDQWYKRYTEQQETINSIHDVLDDLGIKRHRDENKYHEIPLAARLFSWAMRLAASDRTIVK